MKNRAVFLDRDGVINKGFGRRPPNSAREFHLLPGVGEAIHRFNQAGLKVFVVTNQGGVGLGFMNEEALDGIHRKMIREVEAKGGFFDGIAACTHKPKDGCECRKPKPGMLHKLAEEHNVDLTKSVMVGDREVDILAGKAGGALTVYIGSDADNVEADYTAESLLAACDWILAQE